MNKKGGLILFSLKILLVLIVLAVLVFVYFYNFYVFKTLRVCISSESLELNITCNSNIDCVNLLKNNPETNEKIKKIPDFLEPKIDEAFEKAVICQETCKIKEIYGAGLGNINDVEKCKENEEEVIYNIRGKELFKVLSYMR